MKVSKPKFIMLIILLCFIGCFINGDVANFNAVIKEKIVKEFEQNKENVSYSQNQLVVKLNSEDYLSLEKKYNVKINALGDNMYNVSYDSSDYTVEEIMSLLNSEKNVTYAEPDYKFTIESSPQTEPYYENEWAFSNEDYGINIVDVWGQMSNEEVVVAVIDTGINYNHPDLENQVWFNSDEIAGNGYDDDGNGYIDDYQGWNFYNNSNEIMDVNGHGSHIGGIIAGEINDYGISGVNPNVKIMALNVSNNNGEYLVSDIVEAINYALEKGVKIFNFSFGLDTYIQSLRDAMVNTDALYICAAGNGGEDEIGDDNDITPFYPASYDLDNIIAVSATNNSGNLASFSNYGANSVDIAAPGDHILSSHLGTTYYYLSGTSMATPFVVGTAAIIYSEDSAINILDAKEYILTGTKILPSLTGKVLTSGLLDVKTTYNDLMNIITFDGGSGTIIDPFLISSAKQLDAVRNNMSASYKLTSDINTSYSLDDQDKYPDDIGWLPIGDDANPFTGTFDGDNHKITGLTIKRADTSYIGLFGYVSFSDNTVANIYDLSIDAIKIEGNDYVGTLIGYGNNVNLQNVYVTSDIKASGDYTGLIIGQAINGVIDNVSSHGRVEAKNNVGGIVGFLQGNITHAYNTSKLSGNNDLGGITGYLNGTIEDVFNLGMLEGTNDSYNVGGIVGNLIGDLNNSYNAGIFNFNNEASNVGLVVGNVNESSVNNSYYINPYSFNNNTHGIELSDEELYNISSYIGFDFTNDWEVLTGNLLPALKDIPFDLLTTFSVESSMNIVITDTDYINLSNTPNTNRRFNYVFTSLDETIVKVDRNGKLTPIEQGTANIKVHSLELNNDIIIEVTITRIIKGDINDDSNVTTTDLVILRRYLAGLQSIPESILTNADINNDGLITLTDLVKLRRFLAGLEEL